MHINQGQQRILLEPTTLATSTMVTIKRKTWAGAAAINLTSEGAENGMTMTVMRMIGTRVDGTAMLHGMLSTLDRSLSF
jgi:hypothetical protein